jgi:uncharacterized phage protein (TIGR02220 family)
LNAYIFLLCNAWLQTPQATLPADDVELADLARVPLIEWMAMKDLVLSAFKTLPSGRLYSERQMEESNKQQNRSKAGSKGGSKKAANALAALEIAIAIENANEVVPLNGGSGEPIPEVVIIRHLNQKAGTAFRENDTNIELVQARLSEPGVTVEDCKKVIDRQCAEWLGTEMEKYLQPSTLFRKSKFENYYAQRDKPPIKFNSHQNNPTSKPLIDYSQHEKF